MFEIYGGRGIVTPKLIVPAEAWEFMGVAVLGAAAASLTVTLPRQCEMVMAWARVSGTSANSRLGWQFNGDSGTNYSWTVTTNEGGTNNGTNDSVVRATNASITAARAFLQMTARKRLASIAAGVNSIVNTGSEAKGTAPVLGQMAGVWDNTTDLFTSVTLTADGPNLNSGTSLIVWGSRVLGP